MGAWSKEARAAWRERNRDKERQQWMAWRAANPEKARASWRKAAAKIAATPEGRAKINARNTNYRKSNKEKANASQYAYWNRPENKERKLARRRELYRAKNLEDRTVVKKEWYIQRKTDPIYMLHRRISSNLRQSLTKGKNGASTYEILGYTREQLILHLERQFLPKMGWHNMPTWHIDHIVPLSSFQFSSPDDPEFKVAWAITNLRPVWASINLRKNARREFLI